jgi:threonine/homoserine/homoserine lactone efflux protein
VGGLFLCYLGVRTFLSAPAAQAAGVQASGPWMAYMSIFALTLTNPMTILSFVAIFAGVGLATEASAGAANYAAALWLVAGVFCGSASWWLLLSGGVSLLRSRLNATALRWVNRAAGAVIAGFGLWLLVGQMI